MKLKVVWKNEHEWIEADTIVTLKASIMDRFCLTADELSQQRVLVRDNRDLVYNSYPITGCIDLLQLADGSTLDGGGGGEDDLCKDGDTLVLGWNRPCIIRLVTDYIHENGHNIKVVDVNSFTLGQLKRKIKRLTGEPATEENLPQVLYKGDDDKPLLFFGYYRFWKFNYGADFQIHRHKNNKPVSIKPMMSMVKRDRNGNEYRRYFKVPIKRRTEEEYKKSMENGKRILQKIIENEKKKNKADLSLGPLCHRG